ncbi:MAG TPA: hypothetical protein VML75_00675 [Kofleriaceae bacterium]|nr:hypothetical protein [Kofleriaceae bacterium]
MSRAAALAALVILLVPATLRAQPITANEPAFSVERLTPVPGRGGFFAAEDGDVLPRYAWSVAAWGTLMSRPIVFNDVFDGTEVTVPVRTRLGYEVLGGVGVGSRYQLGAALPIIAAQDGDRLQGIDLDERGLRPVTIGDLRLHAKARIAGAPGQPGMALAGSLIVTLPTGDQAHFAGEKGAVLEWRLIGSYAHRWFRAAVNLGPRLRTERVILLSPARAHDNELVSMAAIEVIVPGLRRDALGLLAEVAAIRGDSSQLGSGTRGPSPREARAGATWRTAAGWTLGAGVGVGISPDEIGSPAWRVFASARFDTAPAGDLDRDGIPDAIDRCRDRPEDVDGFQDLDGCPDPDNDGDGIPDEVDDCPLQPEDVDGFQDLDGCPDDAVGRGGDLGENDDR